MKTKTNTVRGSWRKGGICNDCGKIYSHYSCFSVCSECGFKTKRECSLRTVIDVKKTYVFGFAIWTTYNRIGWDLREGGEEKPEFHEDPEKIVPDVGEGSF